MNQQGGVSAIIDDQFGPSFGEIQRLKRTFPVFLQRFALPGEDGNAAAMAAAA